MIMLIGASIISHLITVTCFLFTDVPGAVKPSTGEIEWGEHGITE